MSETINLSVVVLVYNAEEFLHQCFDSLINQTLSGIEIIAVDDESTDASLAICQEYAKEYENFKVISQENQGGAVAGNRGVKEAKGKYVALVDSDDFLPLDAYETLFDLCEKNSADFATGRPLRYVNNQKLEVILVEEQAVWEEERVISSALDMPTLLHDKFYWNKIFRRDFIEKHHIAMPDGYLYADFLMIHKAYEHATKIAITNKVVYYWRRHSSQRVVKSASQEIASSENFKERTRSLILDHSDNPEINYKLDELRILLLSFVFNSIIYQKSFQDTFIKESQQVLNDVEDIASHNLHPIIKLKVWLLKENRLPELFFILGRGVKIRLKVVDDKVCCTLPFFLNESMDIPNEVYEYKSFRKEFIKNFTYIDKGDHFTFQVLLHHVDLLPQTDYTLFFKERTGETKHKVAMSANGNYFQCDVKKSDLFKEDQMLFVGIGNSDNMIYRVSLNNCEPAFDLSKKLEYIVHYINQRKEIYFQKRDIDKTIKKLLKRL